MSVTYLETCKGNAVRDLANAIDKGEVTHAVLAYRREDGSLFYRLIGDDDLTYLMGVMDRVKMHMHCSYSYIIPDTD